MQSRLCCNTLPTSRCSLPHIFLVRRSARKVFFDRRYSQNNFAPPWFPATTLTSTGATNAHYVSSVQRTKWLNNTSYY